MSAEPADTRRYAWSVVVIVAAYVALVLAYPSCPLHADTNEDLLLARACWERGLCATAGASSSLAGVEHGALFSNTLAALVGAGMSIEAIHRLTLLLAALALGIVHAAMSRRSLANATIVAAGLGAVWVSGGSLRVLWNPSLAPLPSALLFASCLRQLEGRTGLADPPREAVSVGLVVSVGLAVGLVVESHPVGLLVVPGALFVAGVGTRTKAGAVFGPLIAGLTALAVYGAISPGALVLNATTAGATGLGLALVALVATSVGAVWAQPRFAQASVENRVRIAMAALAAPTLAGLAVRALLEPTHSTLRYLVPVAAPAMVLVVDAAEARFRPFAGRALSVAVGAALIGSLIHARSERDGRSLTIEVLQTVRTELVREGLSLDDVWARASGAQCTSVIGTLAALGMPIAENASDGPDERGTESLVFAAALPDDVAPSRGRWQRLNDTVWVGELAVWARRDRFAACVEDDSGAAPVCGEHDLSGGVRASAGRSLWFLQLAHPSVDWRPEHDQGRPVRRVVYRIPLRIPPTTERRTLRIPRVGARSCETARVLSVEGVTSPTLPADEVVLVGTSGWQQGTLTLEVDRAACGEGSLSVFPPCLAELTDEDGPVVRRALGAE